MSSLFSLIASVVNYLRCSLDPKNIRLKDISSIDKELSRLKQERDNVLISFDSDSLEANAIRLGDIINRIMYLKEKRHSLERL